MASSNSLLSEEQFLCSICLDVFSDPVSIQCGHNFCIGCIRRYWDSHDLCQCPMCKEHFDPRPKLHINTFIAEMVAQLKKLAPPVEVIPNTPVIPITPEQLLVKPGEVPCDVCSGITLKALKSCLACRASFCETHLEPHQIVASFKKHKLIDPVKNLEDRVCKKHDKPLEMFCRSDNKCVCQFCTETDHKSHNTVTIEKECGTRKCQLGSTKSKIKQMIQERHQKVKDIKDSVEIGKLDAEREISESVQVFNALVRSIERSQAELIEVIGKKQKAADRWAERLIKDLEQEITELERRKTELEQLSHTEDHFNILQSSQALCTLPLTKDWSDISVHSGECVGTVMQSVTQLEKTLLKETEKMRDTELTRMQQFAVEVTLDCDTANPFLILSEHGKQITQAGRLNLPILPNTPKRFDTALNVLGIEGSTSGRFYYEVQVKGKTRWDLGVARGSVHRKGQIIMCPENGHWTVGLRDGYEYKAFAGPSVLLSLRQRPQKVGVFVDYEEGEVSFYDVEARSHIYSFTGCTFKESIYPSFNTGGNADAKNSAPLIICPISYSNLLPLSRP